MMIMVYERRVEAESGRTCVRYEPVRRGLCKGYARVTLGFIQGGLFIFIAWFAYIISHVPSPTVLP